MGIDALAWPTGEELMKEMIADGSLWHLPEDLRVRLDPFRCPRASRNWNARKRLLWRSGRTSTGCGSCSGSGCARATASAATARLFGLVIDEAEAPATVSRSRRGGPGVEIHAVRPAIRRTATGMTSTDLVIEITQRRDGYFDPKEQERVDGLPPVPTRVRSKPDFRYRAGATILIDPTTREVRRVIRTPGTIADNGELDRSPAFSPRRRP